MPELNENDLRELIASEWGEYGWQMDVFNKMESEAKRAKNMDADAPALRSTLEKVSQQRCRYCTTREIADEALASTTAGKDMTEYVAELKRLLKEAAELCHGSHDRRQLVAKIDAALSK